MTPRRSLGAGTIPPSAWLNVHAQSVTIEQWLLVTPGTKGIMLIHLSHFVPAMNMLFNERKVVDHMNSVLRIGSLCDCDLLCLYMHGGPACAELVNVAAYAHPVNLHVTPQHMGAIRAEYRNFAAAHTHVVVMGFDAAVCVYANLFGGPDRMPGPPPERNRAFAPPLTSMTNAVTSRAVLVTNGVINPPNDGGEYGPLANQ